MKQRVPFYYNEFGCITSECKDNCCIGGWEIDIDDETYERYNNMTGELKHKIIDSITQNEDEEYCFKLCDGKCPMLDDNGLCEIHKNLGEDYLGVVLKRTTSTMSLPCFEDSRERFLRRRKQWLHLRPGGRPERSGLFRVRTSETGQRFP